MPDERSKYFQDQIFHKMDSKAVFFCNYFLNPNELGGLGSERNMEAKPIVPSFSSDWKIVYAKINELLWCIDASERNWLEILLIKNPKSFLKGKKRRIYEKLEIICNNQKISLAEYLNAYKFILEFFENVIGNGTSKKSNRNNLVGLVWKNENKDVLKNNFFTKPFVLARWFSSQFPEISHMKRRLKIRNNLWVFVNEIFLITKDFFQKFSFLKSKVNKSKNIFRIHRKGLPSIDTFSETLINKRKITKN